jgi:hypothetical protein
MIINLANCVEFRFKFKRKYSPMLCRKQKLGVGSISLEAHPQARTHARTHAHTHMIETTVAKQYTDCTGLRLANTNRRQLRS